MKKLLLLALLPIILAACARGVYKIPLYEVEKLGKKMPNSAISTIYNENGDTYNFEDDIIKTVWVVGDTSVLFSLENKTNDNLKIIWDDAVFIGADGKSSRVIHNGVKLIDKANAQPDTVVLRKTKINESMTPSNNIVFSTDKWVKYSIVPTRIADPKYVIGKTITVSLPIEINGKVTDYTLYFLIEDFQTIR